MARKRPAETRLSEAELAALREDLALAGKDVGVAPDFATPKKSDGLRRLSTKELRARRQSR
ncbi:MAG TPA: hypothetical protein VFB80_07370, partial [Pirellulaceae bacterium]|nr:hypothetical protein [Pirellulaceae bacterium]